MAEEVVKISPNQSQKPCKSRSFMWLNLAILISGIGIIFMVCAFSYGFYELSSINMSLSNMVRTLQKELSNDKNAINTLQQSLTDIKQNADKAQALTAQQEKMIAEWEAAQKGNTDQWRLAEAQYFVKLADVEVRIQHHIPSALALLKQADQSLQNVQDPRSVDIQKAVANDIERLQAQPQTDVTQTYAQLATLSTQIDQLPLLKNPLKVETNTTAVDTPVADLPWWKAGLQKTWQGLRQIVIVRNLQNNVMPLVLPEEKVFLFQNLHSQLNSAIWGLLNQNEPVYQESLTRMTNWVQHYFVQDDEVTKSVLAKLAELQKVQVSPAPIDLSDTLKLFDGGQTPSTTPTAPTTNVSQ